MPLESFILNQFAFDMFDHVLHIRNGLPAAGRLVLLPALFAGVYACSAATNDWPVYRHDTALSGTAPGKGNITSPVVKWEYYLGAPFVSIARAGPPSFENVADLDGDGTLETFSIEDKRIEVRDSAGKPVWSYTVTGFPLGGNVRVCKLSPNRKDQQIISFSHRMDTGEGQGYCFSFENGVTNGHLLWTTGPLTAQYSPTLVVDDVDGDGLPEIVTAPHYRVQIFDGQTGHLKAEVTEAKGRNYGILLTRSRPDAPQKDIFVLSDFVLHAECVRFENGKWAHAWGKKYFDDENAPRPHGREMYIRVGPNPVSPLIDKRHDQLAYMLVDAQRDDQWHLVVHDAASGNQIADIPGVWVWSISDVNRDGTSEILYTPTKEKRPGTYCDIHVGRLDKNRLEDKAVITNARPVLMTASLPLSMHTIADEGQLDLLHSDDFARGRRAWTSIEPGFSEHECD